ncbi:MAG: alpha-galactosidase [Phycisphaerales bacterium]|nr:MAG: alpha-galactosidase [Phycisphaerales bacterium]
MRRLTLTAMTMLAAFLTGCSAVGSEVRSTKGRETIAIDNGLVSLVYDTRQGVFSASRGKRVFIKEGRLEKGPPAESPRTVKVEDNLGSGRAIEVESASGRTYALALYEGIPFVCLRAVVRNPGQDIVVVNKVAAGSMAVDIGASAKEVAVLGCDGLTQGDKERTSYMFLAAANPKTSAGVVCGWVTHERGSGIVSSRADGGLIRVEPRVEYGKLTVPAGGRTEGEMVAIGYFENALDGLEQYANTIAKACKIRLRKVPSGYCTWYSNPHGGASDEVHMGQMAEFCGVELRKFGFEVLQIDDKWQVSRRDFTSHNPKGPYPSGMKATAERINAAGLRAGIWLIPFGWDPKREIFSGRQDWFVHRQDGSLYEVKWAGTCLDMTHPQARGFLREVVARITRQWGYKYIKIDGLWTGMAVRILYPQPTYRNDGLGDAVFYDSGKTNVEAYRDGLKLVREAAGGDVYILGCNVAQNMRTLGGSVGLVDGMRVGSDIGARWSSVLRGATMGTRLYFLHGRVWHNDPDCLMLREPMTVDQARAWGSWIGISGQLNMVSEWLPGLPAERLEVVKRSIPNHGLCGRPVDLFEKPLAQVWHLSAGSEGQRRDVLGLFNWDQKRTNSLEVEMERLGLAGGQYVGFDYWEDKFVGPFGRELKVEVRPSSCRVIAVRRVRKRPVLVSTSRHVTQGIVDVVAEEWDLRKQELRGSSAVVAGDPYELRIYDPAGTERISAAVSEADIKAGVLVETRQDAGQVRVTIKSPENRQVTWRVRFLEGSQ